MVVKSREAIIASTLELIEAKGFAAINVSAVATAAGVSRQTVYSVFGSREEMVSQAVISAVSEMLEVIAGEAAATDTACAYIVELIVAGRREARRHPLLLALLRAERNTPLLDEGTIERAMRVAAGKLEVLTERDPALADPEVFNDLVEMVTRLGMSVALFDSERTRTDAGLRRFLACWLEPSLRRAE